MKEDIFKILSNSNKDIDNQKLMDYLSGKLSDREQHEVEEWLAANDFASDAIEGLEGFRKGGKLDSYVAELNKDLHQYLQQNRERRKNVYCRYYCPADNNPGLYCTSTSLGFQSQYIRTFS
jgi:hypothetical protein